LVFPALIFAAGIPDMPIDVTADSGGTSRRMREMHLSPVAHGSFLPVKKYCQSLTVFGKLLQPEAIFGLKMHKSHFVTGLCMGPQGELTTVLPHIHFVSGKRV